MMEPEDGPLEDYFLYNPMVFSFHVDLFGCSSVCQKDSKGFFNEFQPTRSLRPTASTGLALAATGDPDSWTFPSEARCPCLAKRRVTEPRASELGS